MALDLTSDKVGTCNCETKREIEQRGTTSAMDTTKCEQIGTEQGATRAHLEYSSLPCLLSSRIIPV